MSFPFAVGGQIAVCGAVCVRVCPCVSVLEAVAPWCRPRSLYFRCSDRGSGSDSDGAGDGGVDSDDQGSGSCEDSDGNPDGTGAGGRTQRGAHRGLPRRGRRGSKASGIDSLLSHDMAERNRQGQQPDQEERTVVSSSSVGVSQRLRKLIEK
jgi:hypothetical protein